MKCDGKLERLPDGMRFMEVADFSIELSRRAEVLRVGHRVHFFGLLDLANKTLGKQEAIFFICFS